LENGAAVKINNLATLTYKLDRLLSEPTHLARLRENARRLATPEAAFNVARAALDRSRAAGRSTHATKS
jgi:processive 1,2-diacylglycerol beta-glucosyltransferase